MVVELFHVEHGTARLSSNDSKRRKGMGKRIRLSEEVSKRLWPIGGL